MEILGPAIAYVLAVSLALGKLVAWQGDLYDKWHDRVALSLAGLEERAGQLLILLQGEISKLLVGTGGVFDPTLVVADPAALSARVADFQRTMTAHAKLEQRFDRMCAMARWVWLPAAFLITGGVLIGLRYSELVRTSGLGVTGLVLVALGAFLALVALITYRLHAQWLTRAEMLANKRLPSP
jgi:hypothetical protein